MFFLENLLQKIHENKYRNFVISIAGESASGKTTTVNGTEDVMKDFSIPCTVMNADDYFKDVSQKRREAGSFEKLLESGYSFDTPNAINIPLLKSHLFSLKNGVSIKSPSYSFQDSSSIPNSKLKNPSRIILHEGLFALNNEFDGISDAKVYIKAPFDIMKQRWFKRTAERNTVGKEAIKQFKDVTDKARTYIYPQEQSADIVLNGLSDANYQKEVIKKLIELAN